MRHRILLVEDHPLFLQATQKMLEDNGYQVDSESTAASALDRVRESKFAYSLVVLDYKLERDGSEVVSELAQINPDLYVVIYSADNTRDALRKSWRAGAVDFIDKNAPPNELLSTIRNWCQKYEHTHLTISLPNCLDSEHSSVIAKIGMVGRSAAMAEIVKDVLRYREKRQNVLVLGESGVGKELIAQALHSGSRHLFRAFNCASYNTDPTLMEAELFGAEKGAYTGADSNRKGLFADANGGTVFLDEIHTLSLKAQEKLLRVLETRTVRPVGGTKEIPVNFRLVAAAKPDIEDRIAQGKFLSDLYYRLETIKIIIPALRERPEDIAPLVAHFCEVYSKRENEKKAFLARTLAYMERYPWPGNVRELENLVERLCVRVPQEKIAPEHLDVAFFQNGVPIPVSPTEQLKNQVEAVKREVIESALKASGGKIRPAARRLNMASSSLHYLVKKYGIQITRSAKPGSKPERPGRHS